MSSDLRLAARSLAQSPGATAIAVLTLALGIGAGTAVFTVVNSLLLRPLPYADPKSLVEVAAPASDRLDDTGWLSYGHFALQRERNRSFTAMAACTFETFDLSGHGDAEQIPSARVSWNFFQVLGVKPRLGRTFLPEEDQRGGRPVVLISYELWQRLFGGDPEAVGQHLTLDSTDYTVIGVLPPKFAFPLIDNRADIWAPRVFDLSLVTPARVEAGGTYFHVVGRLRPGVSERQARGELQAVYRQYRLENPGKYDSTIDVAMQVRDLRKAFVGDVGPPLLVFASAIGLVVLIACSNIASLQLARAVGRKKEFAVKTALGARRSALVRQVLTENLLVSMVSAAIGIVLGIVGTHYLASPDQTTFPQLQNAAPDLRVFAFALAVSIGAGVAIGLTPAIQLSRPDLNSVLRDEGRGSAGSRKRSRARSMLVVFQVALSTVLLVGSGLLIHSFLRLSAVNAGFEPKRLLTMEMTLPQSRYSKRQQLIEFYEAILRHVRAVPGVQSAALSTAVPAFATHQAPALFEGQPKVAVGKRPIINIQQLSPDYARTMGIPLLAGRTFNEHDDAQAPPVAMINQAAARRFWPNENPLGKHIWIGSIPNPLEVTGVLGDVRNSGTGTPAQAEVFMPFPQMPWTLLYLSVRTPGDPHAVIGSVRRAIAAVDRDQPLTRILTGEELLASANAQPRFTTWVIGLFSATAFLIAAVGIYGVIAYSVAQRRQELGIRIAVGAARNDIFRLVVGNGLRLTGAGLVLGFGGAVAVTRLMKSLLYQTSATDFVAFAGTALLFVGVGAVATYVPARRAAAVDPTEALR